MGFLFINLEEEEGEEAFWILLADGVVVDEEKRRFPWILVSTSIDFHILFCNMY